MMVQFKSLLFLSLLGVLFFSCNKLIDPSLTPVGYPKEVADIIEKKCATSGCHNDQSYQNAASLNLATWEKMFQGAVNGSTAIPYSPNQSSLMQFINTYPEYGIIATPTMPFNGEILSKEEVSIIRNWIIDGCHNIDGVVPFENQVAFGDKAYISNQGCDIVSVVDAETKLVMRYISVGKDPNQIETPHCLRVSPDKKYWYVCFANGSILQKFDCVTDKLVGQVEIGNGAWNVIKISSDSKTAYVSNLESIGKFVKVDLNSMTVISNLTGSGLFTFPHGMELSMTGDTLYATAQNGNMIYRIIPSIPQVDNISIQKGVAPNNTSNTIDPHEILASPDHSKYFITCQASNEVRVMDANNDTLIAAIPVGTFPLEMTLSPSKNLLFVTCQEETNPIYPAFKGAVYVINISTLTVVRKIYEKFYQPHGIACDDKNNLLYVSSRNANPTGPAPHHLSECGGRNGFYHVIDLNTWNSFRPGAEISIDPYSIDVR